MFKTLCFLMLPIMAQSFTVLKPTGSNVPTPVLVGSTKPIENFDPLEFSKSDTDLQYYREAELKHGRLAMVSATMIPLIERFTDRPAVHEFERLPEMIKIGIVSFMFITEFASMYRGWKNPFENQLTESNGYFKLNEDYQPGDFDFGLIKDLDSDESKELLNKELNNGRLAMIASLGMIVQELVTNQQLIH